MEQQKVLTSPTTQDRESLDLSNQIIGWGADLEGENRPGVPRDKAPNVGIESLYIDTEQQIPHHRIHKSTEHRQLTPVFGSTCPPRGLSGLMRDVAFKYSEGQWAHWLTLMAADRVDMVEHIFTDLAKGQLPNFWKEMGLSAELKYNRKNFERKVAIAGVGLLALTGIFIAAKAAKRKRLA